MAISNTYPTTLAKSRGKTLYRYNVREVEITDNGEPRIAYEYDEVWVEGKVTRAKVLAAMRAAENEADTRDISGAAIQHEDAKTAINLANIAGLTYAQLEHYIDANVTSLASAGAFLKKLGTVVLALVKQHETSG